MPPPLPQLWRLALCTARMPQPADRMLMFSRVCRPLRSCGGWALAVSTGHTVLTGC